MGTNNSINIGGINGLGEGLINTNASDFKYLQEMIKKAASDEGEQKSIENNFLSIRFQMESYLNEEIEDVVPAGMFIEKFLEAIKIKKKDLAAYLGYDDSNLSAIIKGRRKINSEMAIKLGKIFSLNPAIWLHIESKNDLIKAIKNAENIYTQYSLKDLIKKAG